MLHDIIDKLRQVESSTEVVNSLIYRKHSAWVRVKQAILCDAGEMALGIDVRRAITLKGGIVCVLSFLSLLFRILFRGKAPVYFGAASGLVHVKSQVVDSYFPHKLKNISKSSVFLNAGDSKFLWARLGYLVKHGCIVDNYLMWPFYKIIAWCFGKNFEKSVDFSFIDSELRKCGIDIDPQIVRKQYVEYCARQLTWRLLFQVLKPSEAYIVAAYSKSEICSALIENNVEIIEMQHGGVGNINIGYNYCGDRTALPIPDKIFVYNDFWKEELLSSGFDEGSVKIYGRLAYENVDNVPPLSGKYVVFTGQGIGQAEVLSFAAANVDLLKDNKTTFVYKPHPREDVNELAQMNASEWLTIYDGAASTETLIKYAHAHISFYSSCHFDAIYYCGKSFILQSKLSSLMKYYVEKFPDKFIVLKNLQIVFGETPST